MVQRLIILLLLMIVFVGCGEDEPDKVKPKGAVNANEAIDEGPEGPEVRIIWEKDGSKMVLIPAGSFEMGDHFKEGEPHELPVHTVELDAFYMDRYEVTVGQFRKFVEESGYAYNRWDKVAMFSPRDRCPMVFVSWADVEAYCDWAGKRLPTEAEREYAARGGSKGKKGKRYPWGNDITHDDANYRGIGKNKNRDKWDKETAPTGSFDTNGYGLCDMAGNVWEWCADWYGEDYYSNSPLRNPQGPSTGKYRVLRGGSWTDSTSDLRVARRDLSDPVEVFDDTGFRCVSELK